MSNCYLNLFMRYCCLFFVTLLSINLSVAQSKSYEDFEWEVVGVSFVNAVGPELGYGIGIHSEPRYNLTNKISLSLRGDLNVFSDDNNLNDIRVSFFLSGVAFGDYYFNTKGNSRLFAGLGVGFFTEDNSSLGVVPRIGYELSVFRLTADYNYTLRQFTPEYFSIKLGFNIGGKFIGEKKDEN